MNVLQHHAKKWTECVVRQMYEWEPLIGIVQGINGPFTGIVGIQSSIYSLVKSIVGSPQ